MDKAEFDKFADEYSEMLKTSISISGEQPDFFAEYKIVDIAREHHNSIATQPESMRMLDFGSGNGASIPFVNKHFPNAELTCLDVSQRSLDVAKERFPSLANYVAFDGDKIPFPDSHFDIAFAACVFHHIDHSVHASLLKELYRVIKENGQLFIFEHNPLNPLTVRAVNSCAFDVNAKLINARDMKIVMRAAGFSAPRVCYRIFFPNFLKTLRPLETYITWLPLGGQYYTVAKK